MPAAQPQTNPRQAERLRRLEQENAALRTEVQDLRRRLERFTVMQEALFATGRLPR
jgi:regulator of replication initiation timing